MFFRRLQIPGGMQDTLPGECAAKRELEQELRRLFMIHGYTEIETPVLEYYDALNDETFGYPPENLWKTFDAQGRVLALRPDTTIPASRLAAGRLREADLPLRLSYIQSACKYERDTLSMLSEQTQAGVELMGVSGPEADAEVIAMAIEALRSAGIRDFQIELGQAAFFDGFVAQAGLEPEDVAEVRRLMEEKNTLGIQMHLHKLGVSEEITKLLTKLPLLYGPLSKLDKAARLTDSSVCHAALENIHRIIDILRLYGYADDLTLDLGMAQEAGYYSGVIFRAQTAHVGKPILSGGRYDGLNARFGRPLPAVGFAMSLKLAMIAAERQGAVFAVPEMDWLIGYEENSSEALAQAIQKAEALRKQGQKVALAYGADESELEKRKARGSAREILYVKGGSSNVGGIDPGPGQGTAGREDV